MNKPSGRRLKRSGPKRDVRPIIMILCEGDVTEDIYFTAYGRNYRDVRIAIHKPAAGNAPLPMVQMARELQRASARRSRRLGDSDFDEIWCEVDVDEHPNLEQALSEARDAGINIGLTNPCFELWLFLHDDDQRAWVHRHEIQKLCQERGLVDGKRINTEQMKSLIDQFETARTRADALAQWHRGNGSPEWENPSSGVGRLVDRLRSDG